MNPQPKPRVTEILRKLGLSKSYDGISPFYKERGSAVHKAIELYLKGTLDEQSIDEVCRPYFEGFLKWWNATGQKWEFKTELHAENEDYQGTVDLVYGTRIYDFKCSKSHDRAAEPQGAGYKKLLGNNEPFTVVQLPGDGSYKLIEYKSPITLWDAIMTVWKWKTK